MPGARVLEQNRQWVGKGEQEKDKKSIPTKQTRKEGSVFVAKGGKNQGKKAPKLKKKKDQRGVQKEIGKRPPRKRN